jgi:hypothetical protein
VRRQGRGLCSIACCVLLGLSPLASGDDDDAPAAAKAADAQPTLTSEQQLAVGIVVARPPNGKAPERIEAFGLVLDPTQLISDLGEAATAAASEQSAASELARLRALHEGGAGASLKMLEAAQTEQAKTDAQARMSAARFAFNWAPLAAMPGEARQKLIASASSGRSLLLRADLAGRHTIGTLPDKALLDVDGIQVPGKVLGVLRQTTELQSVGLLIEVANAPAGLGPGAHLPVSLLLAARSGVFVPREAVLYDENGAYVYKQAKPVPGQKTGYNPVKVTLLLPQGDGWLVTGVDDDDDIVVRGAAVLWSLQRGGAPSADDDD